MIPEDAKCPMCKGKGTKKEKKDLEVFIGKGFADNKRITFTDCADESPDWDSPGDVVIVLQSQKDEVFTRANDHLFMKKKISLVEALTGFSTTITLLDGRALQIVSKPGVTCKPGSLKVIRGEGFPLPNDPSSRGNLYVEFEVEFPDSGTLSAQTLATLRGLLPAVPSTRDQEEKRDEERWRKAQTGIAKMDLTDSDDEADAPQEGFEDRVVETAELEEFDLDAERKKWQQEKQRSSDRGEAYDEDDEGQGQGCQTQ